ncbi:hypothetical protein H4R24_002131 [Coemansia sp. RSA 988]|nr:hypothetical protein H4R24_002131 [Coemansia sp. RSA 988]
MGSTPTMPRPTAREDPASSNSYAAENDEDEWDKRIHRTGCFKENERVLICHADTGDWRKCVREIAAFKQCMKEHGQLN